MIYLASPYSHPSAEIRELRYTAVCRVAADLMRSGMLIFSPIAHTHGIALHGLPGGWDYWERYDRWMLSRCVSMLVLRLDGWDSSQGVAAESALAEELGKRVEYLDP